MFDLAKRAIFNMGFRFLLSLSEDVIPTPLENAVLGSFFLLCLSFCVFKLLLKNVIDYRKNLNRPQKSKKKTYFISKQSFQILVIPLTCLPSEDLCYFAFKSKNLQKLSTLWITWIRTVVLTLIVFSHFLWKNTL